MGEAVLNFGLGRLSLLGMFGRGIAHYSLFIALSLCLKKGLPLPFGLAIFDLVPMLLRGNVILTLCVN